VRERERERKRVREFTLHQATRPSGARTPPSSGFHIRRVDGKWVDESEMSELLEKGEGGPARK
jgi:hypothetical protein